MSAPTLADRRVHLATVPLRFVKSAPSTLLGIPAAFAFISEYGLEWILAFAAGVALLTMFGNWLVWRRFKYGIGAREIVIESGLLNRNRRSIPFDRIQDVDIERGPLQRLFGLAKVRIETGGAAKDEGVLDSVTLAEAHRLRAALRGGRSEALAQAEVAEPEVESRTLFAMALPRVLLSGLFSFSLIYLAGLFGLLQTFRAWLPFDINDPARWLGLIDDRAVQGYFSSAAIAAALVLALLVGVVAGAVRTLARDYDFRLTLEDGSRFRRERGLFTRTEIVIAKARVQLGLVKTGPLRTRLDAFDLRFQTLSTGKGSEGGHQSVAPFATDAELRAILDAEGRLRLPDPDRLMMVSKRHVLRVALREVLLPLPFILGAAILFPPALLLLGALPLLVGGALLQRHFHRYALSGGLLFVQRGFWRRKLWIVPVARAQAVELTRTFIQRRLGLANLLVDTAGASMLTNPRIHDLRLEAAEQLSAAIVDQLSGRKSGTDR